MSISIFFHLKQQQYCLTSVKSSSQILKNSRAIITFLFTCSLDLHSHRKFVTLWVNCINYRPVHPLRAHQTYSAITGVTGYSPCWQPRTVIVKLASCNWFIFIKQFWMPCVQIQRVIFFLFKFTLRFEGPRTWSVWILQLIKQEIFPRWFAHCL